MKDIILTGPKHSGKTSTGKTIASLRSLEFIDLDELIFQRTGKTPRRLYGESKASFQKAEAETAAIVFAYSNDQQRVIATGGGIIDNPEAVTKIKNTDSIIVYLNISADCAWNRISALPPFLLTENPQETHRILHEQRAAAYIQLADIVIKAEGKNLEEIALEILEHIN